MAKANSPVNSFFAMYIILVSCCYIPSLCCPQYEKEALLQFKSLFQGNMSSSLTKNMSSSLMKIDAFKSWNPSTDCCHWEGVSCGDHVAFTKVTGLDLYYSRDLETVVSSNVLIPLLHLRNLKSLDLFNNRIDGEIPKEIGNLSRLEYLYLGDNKLSGNIALFQNLSNLKELSLSNNLLSGDPTCLFNLESMRILELGGNPFLWKNTNTIPRFKLSWLSLKSSNLSGKLPAWLSNQTNIYDLILNENHLQGILPHWLSKMKLVFLDLSDNQFTGSIPPWLFKFPELSGLFLSQNNFSGRLPDNIGEAVKLEVLTLADNHLTGPISKTMSNLSLLQMLDLSSNQLSSNQFSVLVQNTSEIYYIDLSSNKFSGEVLLPSKWGIEVLLLGQNQFSAVRYQNSTYWNSLKYLDLHDNYITGEILVSLSQFSSLRILNLKNNLIEGCIPNNFSHLSNLQILDLSNNEISGNIPPSLGNLTGMFKDTDDLPIFNDPPYILRSDSPKIHSVEVFWKKLKLSLPGQNLLLYTYLDISNNKLSGKIPDDLGRLKNLKSLNLSNNELSGSIPMSFGDLHSLESLDLSRNNLSGEIPQTFTKFAQLSYLDLSNNKLEGQIPGGPQMDRLNDPKSYANNTGLCGMQIQVPCETKSSPEAESDGSEEREMWLSWEMAGIGYSVAFFTTVLVMFVGGYFSIAPPQRPRCYVRQFV